MADVLDDVPDAPDVVAAAEEAEKLLVRMRTLSGRAAQLDTSMRTLETDLGYVQEELSRLQRTAASVASGPGAAGSSGGGGSEEDEALQRLTRSLYGAQAVFTGGGPGGDLRGLMKPPPPGPFLSLMLGSATNVQLSRTEARLRLKEDYYAFRDRTTPIFILFPAVLLFLHRHPPAETGYTRELPPSLAEIIFPFTLQCYWCWLLWFYCALAMRENVLRVNGSSIRNWWIRHHYWSIANALTVLTMPFDSPACRAFIVRFLYCALLQGLIMFLQNAYQRRRTYTKIALGRANAMDVVSGGDVQSQLKILYPLLLALQLVQATNGCVTLRVVWRSLQAWDPAAPGQRLEWQAIVCGTLFVVMAVGDFNQTLRSLRDKLARAGSKPVPVIMRALAQVAAQHRRTWSGTRLAATKSS